MIRCIKKQLHDDLHSACAQVLVYGVNLLHRTLYRLHTDQLNSMQQCKELSQRLLTLSMHVPVLVMETFCMYSVLFDVPFE